MYIIAGLGNPGSKYDKTRHNCGFAAIDILAERLNIPVKTIKFQGLLGAGMLEGNRILLVKPQTYMNLSGQCIRQVCEYYHVNPEKELIVLYDDVSLPPGQLRVRAKGSAGGHNGIKSIIENLGTQAFLRVKIGVGEKPLGMDLADYVLSRFPLHERADMQLCFDRAGRAAMDLVIRPLEQVMNEYNKKVEGDAGTQSPSSGAGIL